MEQMLKDLESLRLEFVRKLQSAVQQAENEQQLIDLETIAVDTLTTIPPKLLQSDFYTRTTIKNNFIDTDKQNDTDYINNIMDKVWKSDCIALDDSYIQETIDDIVKSAN